MEEMGTGGHELKAVQAGEFLNSKYIQKLFLRCRLIQVSLDPRPDTFIVGLHW